MRTWMVVFLALALAATALYAEVYEIDVSHTTVGFSVSHMVLSNVEGRFKEFSGTVEFDGTTPESLRAKGTVKVASIDTDNKMRDDHLRGPDFFDATQFPDILFDGTRVEQDAGRNVLVGNFTMRGVTKEIRLPFVIKGPITDPYGKKRIGLETSLTINRQDYGVKWSKTMDNGGLVVGDDVTIRINAEAVLQEAPAAAPAE